MRGSLYAAWLPLTVAAGLFLLVSALAPGALTRAQAQADTSLGVDVNPEGNGPEVLGSRDICASVNSGNRFQVDLTIENVTALAALEAFLTYDANVVHVADRELQQQFLSSGGSEVFDASESVPDEDGRFRIQSAIIPEGDPVGVDGSGVLARLTLEAKGPGLTTLSLTPSPTDIADRPVAATLTDVDAVRIGDNDGDSYFDGPILDAKIAVDQACPGDSSEPAVISGGGDGIPAWLILAAVAGVVATGLGGVALFVLRRSGTRTLS